MATLQPTPPVVSSEVEPLTTEEAASVFDGVVRRYLKMSTDEFITKLNAGFFQTHPELERRLDSVLFYLPLIRR